MDSIRLEIAEGNLTVEFATSELQLLLDIASSISTVRSNEDLRYQFLALIRKLIPYEAAAFYIADSSTNSLESCMIAQPLGQDIPADEFHRYISSSWTKICEQEIKESCAQDNTDDKPTGSALSEHKKLPNQKTWAEQNSDRYTDSAVLGSHELEGHFLLVSLFAEQESLLGAIALDRTPIQGNFSYRDLYILQILSAQISTRLSELYEEKGFGVSKTERLKTHWQLTDREIDVLKCVAYGMTTAEIAKKLIIATSTARKHLENIHRKTGVNNRMSLMRFAQQFF